MMIPLSDRESVIRWLRISINRDFVILVAVAFATMLTALFSGEFDRLVHVFVDTGGYGALDGITVALAILLLAFSIFSYRRWREHTASVVWLTRAEETTHQQLLFLQTLVDTIPTPVFYKDRQGRYLGCNRAFESFFLLSRNDIIGKTVFDMGPPEIAQRYHDMDEALFRHPGTQRYSWRIRNPAGQEREVIFDKATFTDLSGTVGGIIGVISDISELKATERALREAEMKYRGLVEESLVGVYVVIGGIIVYANPRFAGTFRADLAETVGKPFVETFIAADDQPEMQRYMTLLLVDSVPSFQLTCRAVRRDGVVIDIETIATRTLYDGKIAIIGSLMDITSRKQLEEELLRTQKLESLGVLAGGIAHDFNNLLTAILGNVNLAMLKAAGSEAISARLGDAERATLKARDLARQLLTFSRGGEPHKKTIALAPLVSDAVSFSLSGSNTRYQTDFPDDLWSVDADEGQISQVINNLVINAGQAMPDGGVITIAGKNIEVDEAGPLSRGRYVRLSVHDQGYGIPKAIRNRIFDPYFTTKERGSGLGLATVYSIVRRHGGNITLASEEGKGTTFFVYLPAAGDRAPDRETEPAATGEAVACMPCRILVVDDEQPILNTVRVILEHFGYRVETARTGNEALELYQAAREQGQGFDTVLLDLTIPGGMGGKQIMAALLTLDPKVKAIVSSGYSDDPLMTDFRRYGFKEAATKPYRAEDLAETIRRVLTSE